MAIKQNAFATDSTPYVRHQVQRFARVLAVGERNSLGHDGNPMPLHSAREALAEARAELAARGVSL